MNNIIAAFAFTVATASGASADTFISTGTIEMLNTKANTVQLVGGDSYKFPADVDLSSFYAGQKVHVSWNSQAATWTMPGGDRDGRRLSATSIMLAE